MLFRSGKITEGAISPKKLLEVSDVTAVENYILKEVQKVYSAQSIGVLGVGYYLNHRGKGEAAKES